jgi:hybrid cluster-associated redox disulfide protein
MRSETKHPNPDATIADLLDAHPAAAAVLLRRGMACVGCTMSPFETVAEAAREYRINLNSLLEELSMACNGGRELRRSVQRRAGIRTNSNHQRRENDS